MKRYILTTLAVFISMVINTASFAETVSLAKKKQNIQCTFPNIADADSMQLRADIPENLPAEVSPSASMETALWPFGKKDKGETESESETVKPKSTRIAFFLSLLFPGLGETYVGSKRNFIFFGVEAVAIWMYFSYTNKGKDIQSDYEKFADSYWHYFDETNSKGEPLYYNYWNWLKQKYEIPNTIGPEDYDKINAHIKEKTKTGGVSSIHSLPSAKTQQYYEMTGKYDQFVYGWEDDFANNPSLRNADGTPNYNYKENTANIKSPLRVKYMGMRGDSNDKLKAGQRGIYIMLIDRVISAIDAGRLAYHHNKGLESDLSQIKFNIVQKHIIDHKVPMLMISKKF